MCLCDWFVLHQRWNRGHKARGQGQEHKKKSEAKDRNARGQEHKCKCFPKKKGLKKNFFGRSPKKRSRKTIFSRSAKF